MEQINNDATVQASSRTLGYPVQTKPMLDTSKVILVSDVNPAHNRFCEIVRRQSAINSTGGTIYTTPSDRDFYLNSCFLSYIKDATSTSTTSALSVVIGGATVNLIRFAQLTLTAATGSQGLSFPAPIKLDRNSAITISNSTSTANISCEGTISGFLADINN